MKASTLFKNFNELILDSRLIYGLGRGSDYPALVGFNEVIDMAKCSVDLFGDNPEEGLIKVNDIIGTEDCYLKNFYEPVTDTLGFSEGRREHINDLLDKGVLFKTGIKVCALTDGVETKYLIYGDGNHRLSVLRNRKAEYVNAVIEALYTFKDGRLDFSKFYLN